MPDSQIDEIKNRLNILDIVGSYVKLTKTGVNYRGICPFHSEKGPSFFVSPPRQMFKCFGCGAGGDIFEFIKRIEGVEFADALKILADKAGVELKKENPKMQTERQRLYEICELACSFFEKQLEAGAWGNKAKEYLVSRGIKPETIQKWRLGYSPDTWQGLSDFLVSRGYQREEIVKAGLAVVSDKGKQPYDRFRGRIIFPIFDQNSRPIGFGARILPGKGDLVPGAKDAQAQPKYINTPQTLLYDKSNVLYGINHAKVAIRKSGQCVLTEGYTDAIMCHQAGFENTVAVSGTALTPRHLDILKRYTDNLLLSFDMDLAGDTATKRGINLAESAGFNIKVVNRYDNAMPTGRQAKDPAEIILENPENWQSSVSGARTIMDFYFDSAFLKHDKNSPQGKKEIGKIILPAIKRLQNKIEQSHWLAKLAEKLDVPVESVAEELKNIKTEAQPVQAKEDLQPAPLMQIRPESRKSLLEEKIISLIFKDPASIESVKEEHHPLFSENIKNLVESIKKAGSLAVFASSPESSEYKDLLDAISLRAESGFDENGAEEMQICLVQLKEIDIRDRRRQLTSEIKKAEQEKDFEKANNLIKQFNLIN